MLHDCGSNTTKRQGIRHFQPAISTAHNDDRARSIRADIFVNRETILAQPPVSASALTVETVAFVSEDAG